MYLILQWTPFPNRYEAMHNWQLERAEIDLKFNTRHYYERAVKTDKGVAYSFEDAERIVKYWEQKYPFADFNLLSVQCPN